LLPAAGATRTCGLCLKPLLRTTRCTAVQEPMDPANLRSLACLHSFGLCRLLCPWARQQLHRAMGPARRRANRLAEQVKISESQHIRLVRKQLAPLAANLPLCHSAPAWWQGGPQFCSICAGRAQGARAKQTCQCVLAPTLRCLEPRRRRLCGVWGVAHVTGCGMHELQRVLRTVATAGLGGLWTLDSAVNECASPAATGHARHERGRILGL